MSARAGRRRPAPAAELAARVEAIRPLPDSAARLAELLAEQSPLFAGRGANEADRLRGYILASFETVGLPSEAVSFVLEELETGENVYTVAAAARALRGAREVPAEAPALLVGAIERLRRADDIVSFDRFDAVPKTGNGVTALAELARTLALLGPRARPALVKLEALLEREGEAFSPTLRAELAAAVKAVGGPTLPAAGCCSSHHAAETVAANVAVATRTDLSDLVLEDQDGTRLTFSERFAGRESALAFFYTRCTNPQKCSLTVTRLARLARLIETEDVNANVAAITYDPGFDRPSRLKAYGADRGMTFSPRCSLLRSLGPFDPLREAFDLGVGFGPVTVNRHRLELLVLDGSLAVVKRFERRLWHEEAALEALRDAATPAI
jgi:cytochrome oxidase Cu insertion factor (SCO1/SenC/PrrC family)